MLQSQDRNVFPIFEGFCFKYRFGTKHGDPRVMIEGFGLIQMIVDRQ